jgi:UDP:flavonoid glycosyltransferase YjiC (YdhE family)
VTDLTEERDVRLLFSFAGGIGHFLPLTPIARAAQRAGHTVAFAGRVDLVDLVRAEGFEAFAVDGSTGPAAGIAPIMEMDQATAEGRGRDSFAFSIAAERAAGLLALIQVWQPDFVVMDEMDYGSAVAAEHAGVPHASVLVIVAGGMVKPELVAEPLDALRSRFGLSSDPDLTSLRGDLVFSTFPGRFRDPALPLPTGTQSLRSVGSTVITAAVAGNLPLLDDGRPKVYFTLGTEFNLRSGDLFQRALTGLSALDIQLIVTVGRQIDPGQFGPQPANVHIHQYIAQAALLPFMDLVVSHGGSGSLTGALAQGIPVVLLPLGADQLHNAERVQALGVGVAVDALRSTPELIRSAAAQVLGDDAYTQAAQEFAKENAALPDPAHAVALIEELVRGRAYDSEPDLTGTTPG